jgi:predicted TIM-barrel fold metal-dependent hydrolase
MSAIDVHTHAFPDSLAPRAMKSLADAADWAPVGDGTVKGLLKSMDAADVDISLICTIATRPDQVEGIVKWCHKISDERIVALPSVHPDTPDAAGWVRRFADEGFAGIKLHPMYQEADADDERYMAIYAACAQTGLFITSHCGKDIAWPMTVDTADPIRFRRVIDRLPDLKLICTHMGGWRDWDAASRHIIGTSCWLETSMSLGELGPQRAAEMIRRHGPDKVLFGSDWPWDPQASSVEFIRTLGLDDAQTRAILYGNASRLLGL